MQFVAMWRSLGTESIAAKIFCKALTTTEREGRKKLRKVPTLCPAIIVATAETVLG